MDNIQLIGSLLIFLVTAQVIEFIAAYHRKTRGRWRERAFGRLTMTLMGSLGSILMLASIANVERLYDIGDPWWFQVTRLVVFVSLPVALAYQRVLLHAVQRETKTIVEEEEG